MWILFGNALNILPVLAAHVTGDEDAVAELLGVPGGVAGVGSDLPDVGQHLLLARGNGGDDHVAHGEDDGGGGGGVHAAAQGQEEAALAGAPW